MIQSLTSQNQKNQQEQIIFDFSGEKIRIIRLDNEPWFVAVDVCKILSLKNTTMALNSLDDDERSKFNLGRQGNVNIINESGLYALILRSDLAIKKGTTEHKFRKWVTSDVLPTLRKKMQEVKVKTVSEDVTPPTFYAKTMLADGTDSEVATRNQAKHLIGKMNKMMEMMDHMEGHVCIMNSRLEEVEAKVRGLDSKIRVFAVDSDSLAKLDLVMGSTLEVVMRGKSYKDRIIKCLKEENAKLRQTVQVMTHNTAWATA